jgi:integration host factor subunit alpha
MKLTKASLINSICDTSNLTKRESTFAVESVFEKIKGTLESGEDVLISGFGKFTIKEKKERKGRNPETGDDMKLRARRVVTFKCSNLMRDKLNPDKD